MIEKEKIPILLYMWNKLTTSKLDTKLTIDELLFPRNITKSMFITIREILDKKYLTLPEECHRPSHKLFEIIETVLKKDPARKDRKMRVFPNPDGKEETVHEQRIDKTKLTMVPSHTTWKA